jgi:UDP-N-acetylmuramyl pentapeptide phosphotransferase/UDP-N-acetylglucosamine-1-phosphate transferase
MPHLQSALWAILLVAGCAGLSALLIWILRPLLVRFLMAQPNARSSHKIATPQGAGLAVMGSLLIVVSWVYPTLAIWVQEPEPNLVPILATAIGLTVLGALDDAHALPVSWRLIGQMLAALVLVFSLPEGLRVLPGLLPFAVERALIALGAVWFINAINFLDGLDWMTVVQVVPMTLGIVALQVFGVVPESVGLLALALLGATLGFAAFNKHPAQIFLGDSGSLPIGFCLAFMLIFVAQANLVAALLLSLYTLADATLTLLRRLAEGEPIFSAHRTHFYQRAVAEGFSVPQVTARIFLFGCLLAILAVGAALVGSTLVDLAALGLGICATSFMLWRLARGPK